MRKKAMFFSGALLLLMLSFAAVQARDHSAEQLSNAGWNCVPAGPNDWIHCFAPGAGTSPTVQVKVFGVTGEPYLGTELLIHRDIYNGQPCPQDGLETYDAVAGTPYMACHHFETSH